MDCPMINAVISLAPMLDIYINLYKSVHDHNNVFLVSNPHFSEYKFHHFALLKWEGAVRDIFIPNFSPVPQISHPRVGIETFDPSCPCSGNRRDQPQLVVWWCLTEKPSRSYQCYMQISTITCATHDFNNWRFVEWLSMDNSNTCSSCRVPTIFLLKFWSTAETNTELLLWRVSRFPRRLI